MLGPDQIALHSVLIEYGSPIFGTDDNEFETLEEAIDFLETSADIKPSFLKPLQVTGSISILILQSIHILTILTQGI